MEMEKARIQWNLTLKLLSPMQIGAGTLGMIEKTELYIPGRVVWGAFTATLVQKYVVNSGNLEYQQAGQQLGPWEKHFSSFFPSLDGHPACYLPVFQRNQRIWKQENQLLGDESISDTEMQAMFMTGIAGHATDPDRMATFDESLHETDLIAPLISEGNSFVSVCFKGTVQLPDTIQINDSQIQLDQGAIEDVFNRCRLGGGRKRGRGMVMLQEIQKSDTLDSDLTCRTFGPDATLITAPNHIVKKDHRKIQGRAFLASYRQYCNSKGFGRNFTDASLCWEVGSVIFK